MRLTFSQVDKQKPGWCISTNRAQPEARDLKLLNLADSQSLYVLAQKGQVNCHCCNGETKKAGRFQNKNRIVQRYQCKRCGKTTSESQPLDGIRIDFKEAAKVVHLIAETMGIRAISRFTGFDQQTVLNVLESSGEHCARLLDARIKNLNVAQVQADEVFSYVQQKPNGENSNDPERGEFWTFLAIARIEKLIISWRVCKRQERETVQFLFDLKDRMDSRFQLTTDGYHGYTARKNTGGGVHFVLGDDCDYATEIKTIIKDPSYTGQRAYFAPKTVRVHKQARFGEPDMSCATTNHAERTNLSLRTFNRRFVRCTINFSKKVENHRHAVAIFVAVFNFCRVHKSLNGQTPAMAAGLTDHVWTIEELLKAE